VSGSLGTLVLSSNIPCNALPRPDRHLPNCRMGTCEEVAAAVAFLASDEAAFITGHPLIIDGGYTTL